jgi:hypothetical protein
VGSRSRADTRGGQAGEGDPEDVEEGGGVWRAGEQRGHAVVSGGFVGFPSCRVGSFVRVTMCGRSAMPCALCHALSQTTTMPYA